MVDEIKKVFIYARKENPGLTVSERNINAAVDRVLAGLEMDAAEAASASTSTAGGETAAESAGTPYPPPLLAFWQSCLDGVANFPLTQDMPAPPKMTTADVFKIAEQQGVDPEKAVTCIVKHELMKFLNGSKLPEDMCERIYKITMHSLADVEHGTEAFVTIREAARIVQQENQEQHAQQESSAPGSASRDRSPSPSPQRYAPEPVPAAAQTAAPIVEQTPAPAYDFGPAPETLTLSSPKIQAFCAENHIHSSEVESVIAKHPEASITEAVLQAVAVRDQERTEIAKAQLGLTRQSAAAQSTLDQLELQYQEDKLRAETERAVFKDAHAAKIAQFRELQRREHNRRQAERARQASADQFANAFAVPMPKVGLQQPASGPTNDALIKANAPVAAANSLVASTTNMWAKAMESTTAQLVAMGARTIEREDQFVTEFKQRANQFTDMNIAGQKAIEAYGNHLRADLQATVASRQTNITKGKEKVAAEAAANALRAKQADDQLASTVNGYSEQQLQDQIVRKAHLKASADRLEALCDHDAKIARAFGQQSLVNMRDQQEQQTIAHGRSWDHLKSDKNDAITRGRNTMTTLGDQQTLRVAKVTEQASTAADALTALADGCHRAVERGLERNNQGFEDGMEGHRQASTRYENMNFQDMEIAQDYRKTRDMEQARREAANQSHADTVATWAAEYGKDMMKDVKHYQYHKDGSKTFKGDYKKHESKKKLGY